MEGIQYLWYRPRNTEVPWHLHRHLSIEQWCACISRFRKGEIMKHWDDITPKEQIARWEQVLRVLRGLTKHERKKHFNMGFFGQKTSCGTVACAAGHCGLDPWFRRRGFKLDFIED